MLRKIAVNSQSTGKFSTEVINNRPHIVTQMVSIEGDSVMNGLFYPLSDITNTFSQLDALPVPAGHPVVNGVNISAFHPMAINAYHVGGMVRNPRMVRNQVINDLVFDIEVANRDERGKEIIRRIENGESIGVSTGLNATVTNQKGESGGSQFNGVVSDIKFDHVAALLNEAPAGENTFTLNSDEDLIICNVADSVNKLRDKVREAAQDRFGSNETHIWIEDILLNPDRAIVETHEKLILIPFGYDDAGKVVFTGEGVEVEREVSFKAVGNSADDNKEVNDMDKEKLVLAIIGNSANHYSMADKDSLMSLSEAELVNGLHSKINTPAPSVEQAQAAIEAAGLTVNSKEFDKDAFALFNSNRASFDEYLAGKTAETDKKVAHVLANSKMDEAEVRGLSDTGLDSLVNALTPSGDFSAQGQSLNNNDRSESETSVDYSH